MSIDTLVSIATLIVAILSALLIYTTFSIQALATQSQVRTNQLQLEALKFELENYRREQMPEISLEFELNDVKTAGKIAITFNKKSGKLIFVGSTNVDVEIFKQEQYTVPGGAFGLEFTAKPNVNLETAGWVYITVFYGDMLGNEYRQTSGYSLQKNHIHYLPPVLVKGSSVERPQ